ncbi:PepSY domain-containing protein [Prevotella pectinovora]|nr:PepSY domain-containing protein [Prevotella pectinovora]
MRLHLIRIQQILYAIAALIGSFLPVSGYYMWWKRNRKG